LGFSWDVQKTWDFFGIFLGFFWDPRKSGIFLGFFWDWARLLEYSDIFCVSLRRFWILLLPALVTHTYNTYERLFRHGDVYKCFFLLPCDCFGPSCISPKPSQNDPNFFGMIPNFLGFIPNDPKKLGIFWDLLGSIPKNPRIFSMKNFIQEFLGFFGIFWDWIGMTPNQSQKIPKNPKFFGMIPKIWGEVRGCLLLFW